MKAKKDIVFHLFLFGTIAALAIISAYLYAEQKKADQYAANFLASLANFSPEASVQDQDQSKNVPPGALRVPILIYHSIRPHSARESFSVKYYDVSPESFEKQLAYLKTNNFTVIGLDRLADALTQNILLPPKTVVLTFDDGWENQYKYAFPILKKYGDTATFFVFTDAIGHAHFLTWSQIKEMDNAGMTIGGHTESHPYLSLITDKNILRQEIIGGKDIIANHLNKKIDLFAYPFGQYNDQIISVVKEAGYRAARSSRKGVYHTSADLFKLYGMEVTDSFDNFVKIVGKQ